jgi:beta-glucosidase
VQVLTGRVNPSGKLGETFPLRLSDTPAYLNFPGENNEVRYGEGIYVGYRGYEKLERDVLFPFGFGLSYTQFAYSDLHLSAAAFSLSEPLEVSLKVTNTGSRAGSEIVQVYVRDVAAKLHRPVKELKGFAKVALEAGETKAVTITLTERAFSYYDPAYGRWLAEAGEFEILVGASSADIRLAQRVELTQGTELPSILDRHSSVSDWLADEKGAALVQPFLAPLMGGGMGGGGEEAIGVDTATFFKDLPLLNLLAFMRGALDSTPEAIVDGLLAQLGR